MSQFWIKYIFRVAHIGSIIGLCHKTFTDFAQGFIATDNALFYTVLGIVAVTSGFVNTFLLKPQKMGEKRKLWVGFHHLKLAISLILYLPIGKWIMSEPTLMSLRLYWVLATIFISPYMRFYREANSDKHKA